MQDMATATLTLPFQWNLVAGVSLANPFRILGRRTMGAGAAVDLFSGLAAVAEVMRRSHFALKPCGVCADGWR
jgi:hypothetical protein